MEQAKKKIVHKVKPAAAAPRLERVAAYCRVSSGKDAMLHSLSAQISRYSEFIQHRPGWAYAGVYADEALTGTKDDRPEFQRLLADCRAGRIDRVLTKSISRFARNTVTLLETVRAEFDKMGVPVDNEHPDYVVIAYDTELDYEKMTAVCDFVRAGLPYIATHPDYNCPTETGFAPDIGAIIAFIKASTGREPQLIIGKPYSGIVKDALMVTGLQPDELAMCGDRLYTDIATGVNFGMTSILVMSGETTWEDRAVSETKPTLTFDRLASMIPYLEKI